MKIILQIIGALDVEQTFKNFLFQLLRKGSFLSEKL